MLYLWIEQKNTNIYSRAKLYSCVPRGIMKEAKFISSPTTAPRKSSHSLSMHLNHKLLDPFHRFWFNRWIPIICISNKFPGATTGLGSLIWILPYNSVFQYIVSRQSIPNYFRQLSKCSFLNPTPVFLNMILLTSICILGTWTVIVPPMNIEPIKVWEPLI